MVFALCAQHSPEVMKVVLVEGSPSRNTFTDFADYPHVIALPKGALVSTALTDLVVQRKAALRAADGIAVDENAQAFSWGTFARYQHVRATESGAELPAVPFTVVVIDDYSVLASEDHALAEVVQLLTRIGRALGLHVLIGDQQRLTSDGITRITDNLSYRIALRRSPDDSWKMTLRRFPDDSWEMTTSADAARLPSVPGVGHYRGGDPTADPIGFGGFMVSPELVRGVARRLASVDT